MLGASHLHQIVREPEDASHVEQTLEQVQGPAVHPAFAQHRLELLAERHVDGVFGRQQVAVGDGLLALHGGAQGGGGLLKDVGTHVLHDGTHDDDAGEREHGISGVTSCRIIVWGLSRSSLPSIRTWATSQATAQMAILHTLPLMLSVIFYTPEEMTARKKRKEEVVRGVRGRRMTMTKTTSATSRDTKP
ncbi:hypothetical protein EYF80_050303 [Liparis tanakae]|uniref:Uncharacterized protein n=1 Tax=Liparis tanakae TaxID=230148 RepID=A0A4Z2FEB1_9TELE|nr:hypothetical protein EYF80_050303 [Liparis tanakae]